MSMTRNIILRSMKIRSRIDRYIYIYKLNSVYSSPVIELMLINKIGR